MNQNPVYRHFMPFKVIFNNEANIVIAECTDLPGCVSQGNNEAQARKNIIEAITAWLWAESQKETMKTKKEKALNMIRALPDDVSMKEIMYRLYVMAKIDEVHKAIKNEKVLSLEDLKMTIVIDK